MNLLIDPFGSDLGIRAPKNAARIVITSEKFVHRIKGGDVFFIAGPGEYERENVFVQGIPSTTEDEEGKSVPTTLYMVEVENIRIAHLNLAFGSVISDKDIEALGEVDILLLPVGGKRIFLDGATAARSARAIGPKIIIPMAYAVPGLKVKLENVGSFLKAMGVGKLTPLPKLAIKKKNLAGEETRVVVLRPV